MMCRRTTSSRCATRSTNRPVIKKIAVVLEEQAFDEREIRRLRGGAHRVEIGGDIVEALDMQVHVRRRGVQRDLRAQNVAERAVRVRQRAKQIGVVVVGAACHDLAARQQHVGFDQPVVNEAVAKGTSTRCRCRPSRRRR
jgi:hypothetical protein